MRHPFSMDMGSVLVSAGSYPTNNNNYYPLRRTQKNPISIVIIAEKSQRKGQKKKLGKEPYNSKTQTKVINSISERAALTKGESIQSKKGVAIKYQDEKAWVESTLMSGGASRSSRKMIAEECHEVPFV